MIALKVPPLGESIVEATVSRWVKNQGDSVNAGDTVLELDTDKITVEVPALRAGVLSKQAVKEGDVVHVDDLLGEIDDSAAAPAQSAKSTTAPTATAAAAIPAPPAPPATPAPAAAAPVAPAPATGTQKSAPAARRVADERGIDITSVQGTGRGGVVSKPDVLAASTATSPAIPQPAPVAPSAPAGPPALRPAPVPSHAGERETREKLSTRRRRIAENLLQSHLATAHLTTFNEIDMSAVSALRERVKEKVEKQHGVRLSFMPFFVRAACIALRDYPVVNAQLDGDEIIYKNYVNMGIAVPTSRTRTRRDSLKFRGT
jgi:2-oxoglutarate dehydrogenase E2 component (dihydrolipoamide succinyltransferase)